MSVLRGRCLMHVGASSQPRASSPAAVALLRGGAPRATVAVRCSEDAPSSSKQHHQQQRPSPAPAGSRWYSQPSAPSPLGPRPAAFTSLMSDADHPSSAAPTTSSPGLGQAQEQERLFRSLRLNRHWSRPSRRSLNLLEAGAGTLMDLPEVHVIVFGTGTEDHEGVYSHRAMGKDGLPQDTIIGFESKDDAERYACLLEVTMEPHQPHVMHLPAPDLAEFCVERGYQCQVQPVGSHLMPPERNVDLTDWERSQRLRRDQFLVTEVEEAPGSCQTLDADQQQLLDLYLSEGGSTSGPFSPGAGPGSREAALDMLRGALEALLPPPEEDEGRSSTQPQ